MRSAPSPYNDAEKSRQASRRPRRPVPRTALLLLHACFLSVSSSPPEPGVANANDMPQSMDQAPPFLVLSRLHEAARVACAPLKMPKPHTRDGPRVSFRPRPKTTTPKVHGKTKTPNPTWAKTKVGSSPPQTPPRPLVIRPNITGPCLKPLPALPEPRPRSEKKTPNAMLTGLLGLLLTAAAGSVDRKGRRGVLDRSRYVDRDPLRHRSVGA